VTALATLFNENIIDREEFRQMLVNGEILPTATESQDQQQQVQ